MYGRILSMENNQIIILVTLINLINFILYGIDKKRAKKNKYRISEKYLLALSILGAPLGAILGMLIFHHKTKKIYFYLASILGFSIYLYLYLIYK